MAPTRSTSITIADITNGRWPDLLAKLAGLTPDQLTDKHQACPLCGGTDRYRFDDKDGTGSWFCNRCGGKDQAGGAGSGMDMLMRKMNLSYADAAKRIEQHLSIMPDPPRPPMAPTRSTSITIPPDLRQWLKSQTRYGFGIGAVIRHHLELAKSQSQRK